jgi:transcription elongation factor Elf1
MGKVASAMGCPARKPLETEAMSRFACPICGCQTLKEPPIDAYGYQTFVRCPNCTFIWDDRYSKDELEEVVYPRKRGELGARRP